MSRELGTRRPPGPARSLGTAGARALARPRDPCRKTLPHSHPTPSTHPPRWSANFPKNAPTPGHPAGQRGRCCGARAVRTRPWPLGTSRHLRGRSGAPERVAAAADVSPRSPGPASAGDSSRAGACPLFYGEYSPSSGKGRAGAEVWPRGPGAGRHRPQSALLAWVRSRSPGIPLCGLWQSELVGLPLGVWSRPLVS